ncbi:MAG TPA: Tim44/TimA family putative adaptor protein [Alphaproteobacteria bacterium]|nr:Tim44/TimA family putative adaptor protein [Alphaproteobacteria bacterium]
MDVHFIDIIIFAMIAAFLILRLRSVLGRRTGEERQRPDPFRPTSLDRTGGANSSSDKIVHLPERNDRAAPGSGAAIELPSAGKGTPLESGLTQIGVADPNFTPQGFVEGAKVAFEMTVEAFAKGERKTLRPLLSDPVFEHFSAAIKAREDAKQTHLTTLVGVKSVDILDARMDGRAAYITLKFVSDQVNVTKDKDGNVVDGDPNNVAEITDIWTFARNTRSRDPNWTLVETRSVN